jgi:hypothetical protein
VLCSGGLNGSRSFGCQPGCFRIGLSGLCVSPGHQLVHFSFPCFELSPLGFCGEANCIGSVSTMVFGLCANRVIGFVIAFVKDVAAANTSISVSRASSGDEKVSAVPGFEEVTTEQKKER